MTIREFIEGDGIVLHLVGDIEPESHVWKNRHTFIALFREWAKRETYLYKPSHVEFITKTGIFDNICGTQTLHMLYAALPLIDMHSGPNRDMLGLVRYVCDNMECWYFG